MTTTYRSRQDSNPRTTPWERVSAAIEAHQSRTGSLPVVAVLHPDEVPPQMSLELSSVSVQTQQAVPLGCVWTGSGEVVA